MADIVIFGAGDQGECTVDVVERGDEHRIVGFVDDGRPAGDEVAGYPVLGRTTELVELRRRHGFDGAVVAIGDNYRRRRAVEAARDLDPSLPFVTVIDPTASIGGQVSIGEGTVIQAEAVVNRGATIGVHGLLCVRASLDHHAVLGDYSSLAPNVATGGRVRVGSLTAICIGSTINHGLTVGDHTVVGAGSTVVRNVRDGVVAMGTPCRTVRPRSIDDPYL